MSGGHQDLIEGDRTGLEIKVHNLKCISEIAIGTRCGLREMGGGRILKVNLACFQMLPFSGATWNPKYAFTSSQ